MLSEINKLERAYRKSFTLYNFKGVACAALGKTEQAIKCYKEAIKINPDFAESILQSWCFTTNE